MNFMDNNFYVQDLIALCSHIVFQKPAHILVTGASGLIGSVIVDAIMMKNKEKKTGKWYVYALGRSKEKLERRFNNWNNENITYIVGDVTNIDLSLYEFDYIFHTASNADPRTYAIAPADTILTNVLGTYNIAEYARKHPNVRVVYTSSFEVYGKIEGVDVYDENKSGTIDCSRLRSGYPESKRTCELLFRSYGEQYGIDFVIARLCSVYGPTMSVTDSKAHAQFIRNALKHEDIVLKSAGTQRRSYAYVMDIVDALFFLLENGESREIYNVANSNSTASIAEVAQMVADFSEQKVIFDLPDEIEKVGFSTPQNIILDTQKIERLGWEGRYSLLIGIKKTMDILRLFK